MAAGASKEPVVKQKARMPPSTIPPDQVRQIMAELQGGSAVVSDPVVVRAKTGRKIGMSAAFGLVLVGGVLGAAIGFFAPDLRKPPQIAEKAPAQPSFLAVTPQSAVAPPPVAVAPPPVAVAPPPPAAEPALRPEITPAKPVEAVPAAPPAKPKTCLTGGACTTADVRAAERRLQNAYDTARRAGVPSEQLTSVKKRWNTAKARSAGKPRTTVGTYRSLASELYGKADRAKAKTKSKKR